MMYSDSFENLSLFSNEPSPVANGMPERSDWQSSLSQRLRTLLLIKPLFDILSNHAHHDEALQHYDVMLLTLKIFDLIIETTGLDRDLTTDDIHQELKPLLIHMDQANNVVPGPVQHDLIVDWLLSSLRNDKQKGKPFKIGYADFLNGTIAERKVKVWLLRERFHPDGRIVLYLSDEAINVYLKALALDLEDAQAATEAVLQSQFARGQFAKATGSAREARIQTIRYQEMIDRLLRDTRRDLRRVDWDRDAPRMLKDADAHIRHRLSIESYISQTATEHLDLLVPGSYEAQQVAETRMLVEDCWNRHTKLHALVIRARGTFLEAQERQSFAAPRIIMQPDLTLDVLEPLLATSHARVEQWVSDVFFAFLGPRPPRLLNLAHLISRQLQTPREQRPQTVVIQQRTLTKRQATPRRYTTSVQQTAERYFLALEQPTLLSMLLKLAGANGESDAVIECLALTAFRLFAPSTDERLPITVQRVEGAVLESDIVYGDELLLIPRRFHGSV